jgi:hypothetical protein
VKGSASGKQVVIAAADWSCWLLNRSALDFGQQPHKNKMTAKKSKKADFFISFLPFGLLTASYLLGWNPVNAFSKITPRIINHQQIIQG